MGLSNWIAKSLRGRGDQSSATLSRCVRRNIRRLTSIISVGVMLSGVSMFSYAETQSYGSYPASLVYGWDIRFSSTSMDAGCVMAQVRTEFPWRPLHAGTPFNNGKDIPCLDEQNNNQINITRFSKCGTANWIDKGPAVCTGCNTAEAWTDTGTNCTRPDTIGNGPTCQPSTKNPITLGTGNKWLVETDITGSSSLRLTRTYNSNPGTVPSAFGKTWRSTYSQFIGLGFTTAVWLYRPDGKSIKFNVSGTTYECGHVI